MSAREFQPPTRRPAAEFRVLRVAERSLSVVETVSAYVAALALATLMVIVSCDVAMRYIFNRPFAWAYDFVSLYVSVALFFLALSKTFAVNRHISVDLLHHFVSRRTRSLLELIICCCSAYFFALITVAGAERAWSQYAGHEIIAGAIPWPAWVSAAFVPFGCGLITARLVVSAICHIVTLASGVVLIPLPPISGSLEATERGSIE
jgi:TRAP-type C4-dicarboxylate transport system permease small subunit